MKSWLRQLSGEVNMLFCDAQQEAHHHHLDKKNEAESYQASSLTTSLQEITGDGENFGQSYLDAIRI